jgi:hypothetical protein
MRFSGATSLAATASLAVILQATAAGAAPAPVVFFDIAAPALPSQAAFYHDIFDWTIRPDGGFSVPVASPLPGNLRVESASQGPVTERVVYIGVPDINATLAKIVAHGGSIVFPRQVVPGIVILALFKDPAGNRMGLVEMDGSKPRIPPGP